MASSLKGSQVDAGVKDYGPMRPLQTAANMSRQYWPMVWLRLRDISYADNVDLSLSQHTVENKLEFMTGDAGQVSEATWGEMLAFMAFNTLFDNEVEIAS